MFLKMHNPATGSIHIFECQGETRLDYEEGNIAEVQKRQTFFDEEPSGDYSNDVRRFFIHQRNDNPATRYRYVEVHVAAGDRRSHPLENLVVLTNWSVYLMNDAGQTVDRLFASPFEKASSMTP